MNGKAYSAGFYPFRTEEEKWAYWSRHIRMNRYDAPVGEPYRQLLKMVEGKPYFVITTNVDAQFYKAGFDPMRIWAVQGDYGKLQCACGCHDTLYDNHDLMMEMCEKQRDCRIPSDLVPHCPRCGERMEINIRKDMYFVQDARWYAERGRYQEFLEENKRNKVVFLELGVGYNTPTIIRYPFEQMAANWPQATLVRIGRSQASVPKKLGDKGISIDDGSLDGKRFCNEMLNTYLLLDALQNLAGGEAYVIADSNYYAAARDEVDFKLDAGTVVSYDTLEDACVATGIDYDGLIAEIDEYNTAVDDNTNPEFDLEVSQAHKITDGPFYVEKAGTYCFGTLRGLKTDASLNVLNENQAPVEGLYAAGETAVGNAFNGQYAKSGGMVSFGFNSGTFVAQEIIDALK